MVLQNRPVKEWFLFKWTEEKPLSRPRCNAEGCGRRGPHHQGILIVFHCVPLADRMKLDEKTVLRFSRQQVEPSCFSWNHSVFCALCRAVSDCVGLCRVLSRVSLNGLKFGMGVVCQCLSIFNACFWLLVSWVYATCTQPRFESFLLFDVHASGIRIFVQEVKSLFRLQCYCSIVLLAMHHLPYLDWFSQELRFSLAGLSNLPPCPWRCFVVFCLPGWNVQASPSWKECLSTSNQKVIDGATNKSVHLERDASSCLLARRRNWQLRRPQDLAKTVWNGFDTGLSQTSEPQSHHFRFRYVLTYWSSAQFTSQGQMHELQLRCPESLADSPLGPLSCEISQCLGQLDGMIAIGSPQD